MYHLGSGGLVLVRRASGALHPTHVESSDINTTLNRIGFDGAYENLITGDRLVMTTDDPRGLAFFAPSAWSSGVVEDSITTYVHVDGIGGLRCYKTFSDAVSDSKSAALSLAAFSGGPIQVKVGIEDISYNVLGDIRSYSFNTDRENIDTTALSDKFRNQYNAGLLTGSGTIDCLFSTENELCGINASCPDQELSLLLLQLIQRVDVGAQVDLYLSLVEPGADSQYGVFYELSAVLTKTGIEVRPDQLIACSIDFVTTGEFRLRIGTPLRYLLKEDSFRISLERDIGFLLTGSEE